MGEATRKRFRPAVVLGFAMLILIMIAIGSIARAPCDEAKVLKEGTAAALLQAQQTSQQQQSMGANADSAATIRALQQNILQLQIKHTSAAAAAAVQIEKLLANKPEPDVAPNKPEPVCWDIPVRVAKEGCHTIHDEAQCVQSVDGRSGTPFAEQHALNGAACAWCCGKACVTDGGSDNKCEPYNWIAHVAAFSGRSRYRTTKTEANGSKGTLTITTTLTDTCALSVKSEEHPAPAVKSGVSVVEQPRCSEWCSTGGCSWTTQYSCPWADSDGLKGRATNSAYSTVLWLSLCVLLCVLSVV